MNEMGIDIDVIRAGSANMFLSPIFRGYFVGCDRNGDRAVRYKWCGRCCQGAGIGAGIYQTAEEAFASFEEDRCD